MEEFALHNRFDRRPVRDGCMTKLHTTRPTTPGGRSGPWSHRLDWSMGRWTALQVFTRIARHLPDWTILSYDRRGYAGSADRASSTNFADQIDDLLEVLDRCGPGESGRVIAFGHSLGGDVVLGAVARQAKLFSGAVVYEAPASWEPWWDGHATHPGWDAGIRGTWPRDSCAGWSATTSGIGCPTARGRQRRSEGTTMIAEISALTAGRPFDPDTITVPVIVARGQPADPRQVRSAAVVAATIPGAELVVVEGADHGAHLGHPEEIAKLIRRCLARADKLAN